MYKLRIDISWMSENVMLLLTYIYVDTYIFGEWKNPVGYKEPARSNVLLSDNLCFFVFDAHLMFKIDRVFTPFTMLIHTKCINYAYTFHG